MARKSKKQTEGSDVLLSEQEVRNVWDFYKFAMTLGTVPYQGILTPQLINQRMQDITLNPVAADQDKLNLALASPKESELDFMGISEGFEITSQPYKRLLSYLSSMLSFDLTMTCVNAEKDDYRTTSYKKDLKAVESFLDRFDYKKEFLIAVAEMLRNETFFCSPRFDSEKVVLQELPASPEYTKITGRWAHGLLFSINMYFFLLAGVDINMFDKFFAKSFKSLWGTVDGMREYVPSASPFGRGSSSWVYWQDVPVDVGWAFKMTPELATRIPYFTGLFNDLILQPTIRTLQKNSNIAAASKLLVGEVPFLKDAGAKVADQIAMTPETLGKFLQLVSSALPTGVKPAAAPLANMQGISFSGENDIYSSYLKNMLAMSGINTNLIFTNENRPNQLESQLSLNTDEQLMVKLYPQFNSFMNYHANKTTRKFKWSFEFEGTNFFTNRAERLDKQIKLMENGIVLPQKISAAIGMRYQDFRRQMEEGRELGFVESLTPILQAAQISAGGRPSLSENKLGDAGAQTRESGSNESKNI